MTDLDRLVRVLAGGGVVACPTETLLGLLADALRDDAVAKVVWLKGRAPDAPMAVLLPDEQAWLRVARDIPAVGRDLARAHWPGPLTLVTWARPELPAALVRDGKVGARVPGPSPALDLVRAFGAPLTATSANLAGSPPACSDSDLEAALGESARLLDAIVPGRASGGEPSTVVDVTADPPRILRAGAVPLSFPDDFGEA